MHRVSTIDLTPFYQNTVGLDKMFDILAARAHHRNNNNGYPPHNVIRIDDDHYVIEMALAGFDASEIDVQVQDGQLVIRSDRTDKEDPENPSPDYLHQGISARGFVRTFNLAEYVEVVSSSFRNGILTVALERHIPEAKKPRKIAIESK